MNSDQVKKVTYVNFTPHLSGSISNYFETFELLFKLCVYSRKPPVLFTYIHFVPLIIFLSRNAKNKAIRKHKPPSHSINNLKPKKYCGQYCGLLGKKGKLNMITSTVANKYAVVKSFGFSSVVGLSCFFLWKS